MYNKYTELKKPTYDLFFGGNWGVIYFSGVFEYTVEFYNNKAFICVGVRVVYL